MDGQVWKSAAHGGPDAPGTLVDLAALGDPEAFAGLLRAPAATRGELLDDALDKDMRPLVAQALHVCDSGSTEEILLALKVLDAVAIAEECPELLPDTVRVLTGLCRPDQDVEVLAAALPLYGAHVPGPSAAQVLLAMSGHPDSRVRAGAVDGIEYFTDEGTFPPATMDLAERLARMLAEDPDAQVRLAVAEAFGMMENWAGFQVGWVHHMVAALARAVGVDQDPAVRRAAAKNLAQTWQAARPEAAEALRPYIGDGDPYVAAWALARLACLGDPAALDRLWTVLAAPDVHREYLSAATELFVSYRGDASRRDRRRLRGELKRLRKQGWANAPTDEPNWSPQARDDYLKILISRLSPW
ncbi:HEAT repeat-containing protein [Thermomonospora echinospora]|uniref:HEAT repeat-containing protein n=1 Tax=Thermomonospora echinospora TaxID=1992 RepID=A0A1H5YUI8_9ACTN|nr:HEAT repeat domain-containing protein [Thermomonospora echinospora]SEG27929.1 HEAT repeat-containing protein [Thermomonospora echinospora]